MRLSLTGRKGVPYRPLATPCFTRSASSALDFCNPRQWKKKA
nr:MAG TPA: hypothetical protein [Caudoviricetes sp.]DAZ64248.1 MAG TPA: hypothetical protein [Caudoviricetes sp.]